MKRKWKTWKKTAAWFLFLIVSGVCFTSCGINADKTKEYTEMEADVASVRNLDMTNGLSDHLVEDAEITVDQVKGMPKDFIRGVDMSEIIAQENSGVKYYNAQGQEEDIFQILSESGINYVRVRIWNDPYDSDGYGYGGGNCDVENAAEIGKRAAAYGMKLMVCFQYSDFWADASRQMAPKAWRDMGLEKKKEALYDFTMESMKQISGAGGVIGMVQLGNETVSGLADEEGWEHVCELLNQGSEAVREFASLNELEILVALDFTNPEDTGSYLTFAEQLDHYEVDYDVFASTYYPYWNGSLKNLTKQLSGVAKGYGKKVMVAETSYVFTLEDTDGYENTIYDKELLVPGYEASVQGQSKMLRDVIQAVVDVGSEGIGVMYADAAWITVGSNDIKKNTPIWEKYGSGWASHYALSYDENITGMEGGSDVDNEAFFDSFGKVLPSLKTFAYAYSGSRAK